MNTKELTELNNDLYGLLFDVRRSVRYHDRRRGFYEVMHKSTNFLTVLMAGSVIFDLAKSGDTARWLIAISVIAALLAVADMVFTYSEMAALHDNLKRRFSALEINILSGPSSGEVWTQHAKDRLIIEQDEPPIYVVVDGLCRNEVLKADGHGNSSLLHFPWWQSFTRNVVRWEDAQTA